ncbi:MAG: cytochrome c biogenesis protein CcsA [Bacteroidales bacterium]|nr:cytochrome c biogenesis protein CcsA [Bacteroidales bacterium]
MKNSVKILKIAASALTAALVVLMAFGTVYEKTYGSESAVTAIYHHPATVILWVLAIASATALVFMGRRQMRLWGWMQWASVLFIFAGALLTNFTGESGTLRLRPHEPVAQYAGDRDGHTSLPFTVTLDTFEVRTYPGTTAPMDFVAQVRISDLSDPVVISMNNIGNHRNYRFYMSDYDKDGSIELLVSHDPWGIAVMYIGFALLLLSFIVMFCDPSSRFRALWRNTAVKASVLLILLCGTVSMTQAQNDMPRTLPKETAAKMGDMYILYQDRICPVQSFARDFTYKLCGSTSYNGCTAEQVLAGWLFYFDDWKKEPMFKIKGDDVRNTLGLDGKRASLDDFLNSYGENMIGMMLDSMKMNDPRRSQFSVANKQYMQIVSLMNGTLLKMFPLKDESGTVSWYSHTDKLPIGNLTDDEYLYVKKYFSLCQELVVQNDMDMLNTVFEKHRVFQKKHAGDILPSDAKFRTEKFYNIITPGRPMAICIILLGLIFFGYAVAGVERGSVWVRRVSCCILLFAIVYLLVLFVLRWILSGYIPLTGGYETMLFLALCVAVLSLLGGRRSTIMLHGGLLIMGFVLLAAMMEGVRPPVSHTMPVLKSPLLLIHVAVIMFAYALLAFALVNSVAALLNRAFRKEWQEPVLRLRDVTLTMLYPSLFFLAAGIIIGSVWANITWGNYWSWDPKEVWALITAVIYAIPLYLRWDDKRPMLFHLYVLLAFLSVLITYFGVNMLLGGVHSYA